jgi:hypothetical protein
LPVKFGFQFGRTGFRVSPLPVGLYPSCGEKGEAREHAGDRAHIPLANKRIHRL